MVAGHLLKYCHYVEDTEGHEMELRFIRDTDKREVDFVVLRDGRAEFAVECKSGERNRCACLPVFQGADRHSPVLSGTPRHKRFWQCHRQHARPAVFDLLPRSRAALKGTRTPQTASGELLLPSHTVRSALQDSAAFMQWDNPCD